MDSGAERIIVAIDVETGDEAVELVQQLAGEVGVFKVGLELLMKEGPSVVHRILEAGADRIFLDAKLHDIPNTVSGAMRGVCATGAWCVTVHATGGLQMMKAAVDASIAGGHESGARTHILAVTMLTSISQEALNNELNVPLCAEQHVVRLARLAHEAGCDGVISSPHEISAIRAAIPNPDFLIITPGVRPAGAAHGDQARVMTPGDAIEAGASYLVIGRPIVKAPSPVDAARSIALEISEAL